MKNLKLIEISVIGFFVGVLVSVYILFVETSGREIGSILNVISLNNYINYFPSQFSNSIVFNFIYYLIVYMIYTIFLNFLFKINKKITIIILIILLALIGGISFQQIESFKQPIVSDNLIIQFPQNNVPKDIKKYFGEEVRGDLNKDNKEDIAFLIKRNDGDERGDIYYLSSSLKIDEGYDGLNLLYIGEQININSFEIDEGMIVLEYLENDSDEAINYKAEVVDNKLSEIKEEEEQI